MLGTASMRMKLRTAQLLTIQRHLKSYFKHGRSIQLFQSTNTSAGTPPPPSASYVSRVVYDVRHCNSSRAAGFILVCLLPAPVSPGQLTQTISNSRHKNGLAIVVFLSLSGKTKSGIGSEVLLMTELVTQKCLTAMRLIETRKPQRGPESC